MVLAAAGWLSRKADRLDDPAVNKQRVLKPFDEVRTSFYSIQWNYNEVESRSWPSSSSWNFLYRLSSILEVTYS